MEIPHQRKVGVLLIAHSHENSSSTTRCRESSWFTNPEVPHYSHRFTGQPGAYPGDVRGGPGKRPQLVGYGSTGHIELTYQYFGEKPTKVIVEL